MMTNHSIAELKRQLNVAEESARKASAREREARATYYDALATEKLLEFSEMGGVIGITKVRVEDYWRRKGEPNMKEGPFFVIGAKVSYGRPVFTLASIKKNGEASTATVGTKPETVFILPEDNA